ncbi:MULTISPECIES: hypothetical protein [Bacillaceae]|uniref:AAA domain-containing protein n=1 Tax=Domibacillus aminovorans TaxID=29332 RepID=A0A177L029_9BACI|nr:MULTISPECIES: hypothetical protein [Bacillaceae]OAH58655.1 hypothetical protein AWH48_16795 [Domibacillus aminovorans]
MIAFFGGDHKVGTTQIVHSLAEVLAPQINKEVLVLSLATKPDDEFISPTDRSLDHLQSYLTNEYIPAEEIEKAKFNENGYSVIPGPREIIKVRMYSIKAMNQLLKQLDDEERYFILLDAGTDVDSPLFVSAIQSARHHVSVITEQPSVFAEFQRKMEQIITPGLKIQKDKLLYLINKYEHDIANVDEQLEIMGGTVLGVLPKSRLGEESENNRSPLSLLDPIFKNQLVKIGQLLAQKENCLFEEREEKKESPFARFAAVMK